MSKKIINRISIFLSIIILFTACSSGEGPSAVSQEEDTRPLRDSVPVVLEPMADGINVMEGNKSSIDISNTSKGYFMFKYNGSSPKVVMLITMDGGQQYQYDVQSLSEYTSFPLAPGSGNYTLTVNEQIQGTSYTVVDSFQFTVALEDEFTGFLYPSYYVNFSADSNAIKLSQEIVSDARSDLEAVGMIYEYVTDTIEYDYDYAEALSGFYIPNIDETISSEKGICFHYAVLMTSMLRAQRIPTQVVLGYAGDTYHAWISVHTEETGWVNDIIQFDGEKWVRMDPTFASTSGQGVEKFVGDGENYNALLFY